MNEDVDEAFNALGLDRIQRGVIRGLLDQARRDAAEKALAEFDDDVCDALAATHGPYDGLTVREHLERLVRRIRAVASHQEGGA